MNDGFRIAPDASPHQQDQPLISANHGKTGQIIRKSAIDCNQELDLRDSPPSSRGMGHEHSSRLSLSSLYRLSGRLHATVQRGFPEKVGDLLTAPFTVLQLFMPLKMSYQATKKRAEPYIKIVEALPEIRRDKVALVEKSVEEQRRQCR